MDINGAWTQSISGACGENRGAYLKLMAQMWDVKVRSIAEIGVYEGSLSKSLRYNFPEAHLYLVDPWVLYEQYLEEVAGPVCRDVAEMEEAYASVCRMFQGDPQVTIVRKFSSQAAADFDGELDLLYIDGNHSYEFVKEDMLAWMPKVRSGGILSGHDYDSVNFPGVVKGVKEILGKSPLVGTHSIWICQKEAVWGKNGC